MRSARWTDSGIDVDEIDPGPRRDGFTRLQVTGCGICGSDLHMTQDAAYGCQHGDILGHEFAGEVVALGKGTTGRKTGDLVSVIPLKSCGNCEHCHKGEVQWCDGFGLQGGGYAEYAVTRPNQCVALPADLTLADGAIIEPLAVALHGINLSGLKTGDNVLVLGAGPIGLLQALTALSSGCSQVFIFDPLDAKLDLADQYDGITPLYARNGTPAALIEAATQGWGADVVFECSGAEAAFRGIADLLRPGSTLVCVGMPVHPVAVDIVALQVKEITIQTVFRYANVYDRAINLLASGQIDVAPLITGTFAFEDSIAAFERAARGLPEDVKVQIQMPD